MRNYLNLLLGATILIAAMGCDTIDSKQDTVGGFVPLDAGCHWKYAVTGAWANGHNSTSEADSGFRSIDIISKTQSGGKTIYHAEVADTIRQILEDEMSGTSDTNLAAARQTFDIIESSENLTLALDFIDREEMLGACFRSHAFPRSKTRKIPTQNNPLLGRDSVLIAVDTTTIETGPICETIQAQGIGPIQYTISESFPSNGKSEYRMVEFHLGK